MIGNETRDAIYIAGKMTGSTDKEIKKWRRMIINAIDINADLFFYKNVVVDPYDLWEKQFSNNGTEDKEFIRWQLNMVRNSAVVVVIWDKSQSSIGTMAEMTVAHENRIPIIVFNKDNIDHKQIHPYVYYMADKVFENPDDVARYIGTLYF